MFDDDHDDHVVYTPRCCQCNSEDTVRDRFMQRDICEPCWQREDEAVEAAERRASHC